MAKLIERPPVVRWLATPSLWTTLVLGTAVFFLIRAGLTSWAAPLGLFMGWTLSRWCIRLAAYIHPMWFNPLWLNRQGWKRVEEPTKP